MKIRHGFVSNSSSSSFVLGFNTNIKCIKDINEEYIDKLIDNYNSNKFNMQITDDARIKIKEKLLSIIIKNLVVSLDKFCDKLIDCSYNNKSISIYSKSINIFDILKNGLVYYLKDIFNITIEEAINQYYSFRYSYLEEFNLLYSILNSIVILDEYDKYDDDLNKILMNGLVEYLHEKLPKMKYYCYLNIGDDTFIDGILEQIIVPKLENTLIDINCY